jgi:hypothetical protein
MIHKKALLRNFQSITQGAWTVTGINNTTLHGMEWNGMGEVHLTTQVIQLKSHSNRCSINSQLYSRLKALSKKKILQGVMYGPKIGINLLSIALATEDGMEVSFKDHQMTIYTNNELIYYRKRAGLTLYSLHAKCNIILNDVANFPITSTILHTQRRMGHIKMSTLRWMHNDRPIL